MDAKGSDARRRRPPSGPRQEAASADRSSPWIFSLVIADLHVSAPWARAYRDSVVGADHVSGCAEERAKGRHHPVVRLDCT
jgi:hypothetical protein